MHGNGLELNIIHVYQPVRKFIHRQKQSGFSTFAPIRDFFSSSTSVNSAIIVLSSAVMFRGVSIDRKNL